MTSSSSSVGYNHYLMDTFKFIVSAAHHSLSKTDKTYANIDKATEGIANKILGKDRNVPKILCQSNDEKSKEGESERMICQICFSNLRNVLFVPCAHVIACNSCSLKMEKKCPYCSQDIVECINVLFP